MTSTRADDVHERAHREFGVPRAGTAIYDRRTALGLSQSELAKRAGMTQPAINRLETGTTLPSSRTLFRIARALDTGLVVAFDTHLTDAA
jgi:transcriptional regulator with XRE-family HTH domain